MHAQEPRTKITAKAEISATSAGDGGQPARASCGFIIEICRHANVTCSSPACICYNTIFGMWGHGLKPVSDTSTVSHIPAVWVTPGPNVTGWSSAAVWIWRDQVVKNGKLYRRRGKAWIYLSLWLYVYLSRMYCDHKRNPIEHFGRVIARCSTSPQASAPLSRQASHSTQAGSDSDGLRVPFLAILALVGSFKSFWINE